MQKEMRRRTKLRSEDIIKNSIYDYVIVDEISMVKEMFFKML